MNSRKLFGASVLLYTFLSVLSQYGSAMLVDMSFLAAGLFIPLSCFTIIPALDCARSFSQGCAERAHVPFKWSFSLLVISPLIIAFLCTVFASLPPTIFIGALLATGIGGYMDVMTFKWVGKWFKEDHQRMSISNLAATVTGSFIFFMFAFTPLTEVIASGLGIEFTNIISRGEYMSPAISSQLQALVIYTVGMAVAWSVAGIKKGIQRKNCC